ncbi:hypothetical protein FACS1894217_02120 [Clostridia bacterium]|nr:hypothetical protein FACS1894217_02120 [Clostridia bacterium]
MAFYGFLPESGGKDVPVYGLITLADKSVKYYQNNDISNTSNITKYQFSCAHIRSFLLISDTLMIDIYTKVSLQKPIYKAASRSYGDTCVTSDT